MKTKSNIVTLISLVLMIAICWGGCAAAQSTIEQSSEELLDTGEGEEEMALEPDNSSNLKTGAPSNEPNDSAANSVFDLLENQTPKGKDLQQQEPTQELVAYKTAKLIALNKITAKSQELTLKIGEAKYFGNVEIKVHKCLKKPDPYKPNNMILLSVTENKIDEDQLLVFQGWMMSSDIPLSTFEHPVYEIFARDCL